MPRTPPCPPASRLQAAPLDAVSPCRAARRQHFVRDVHEGFENNMNNLKQRLALPRTTVRGYENAVRLRGERRMLSLQVVSVVIIRPERQARPARPARHRWEKEHTYNFLTRTAWDNFSVPRCLCVKKVSLLGKRPPKKMFFPLDRGGEVWYSDTRFVTNRFCSGVAQW